MFDIHQFRTGYEIRIPAGIHHITKPIILSEKNLHISGRIAQSLLQKGGAAK